ncbi:hypothetical protein Y032_0804g2433 [Ancylostoma ceylanicum]|uniref:Chloride transporter, ClC family n=1 Tax=Ancylostoma ceylanicum TaxID=53326 RepID=A0A016WE77_9BILA|nr:hypothetical protein Y032_0804g2433 [Ancylostoma ceylanicum]
MNGQLHTELPDVDLEQNGKKNLTNQETVSRRVEFSDSCEELPMKSVRFSLYSQPTESLKSAKLSDPGSGNKMNSMKMILADWIFLGVLGGITAFLSISVDMMIYYFQEVQAMTFPLVGRYDRLASWRWILSFFSWCAYTVGLICASATFVHYVSPQAIGSGIPEMKTIIRGVILKDYLTFRTLVSKVFGVALSLGSGVPIGKMGPFVHIASAVANQMSLLAAKFDSGFGNETRRSECLAAACAVGVACTFSAPVGGVLFSIEVTTMYFSVRSYWRGFFAACCGAITIRLLRGFLVQTEVTINAFFQTSFAPDAFAVNELPLFVVLGIVCGVLGALYISLYRTVVLFLRRNKYAKRIFQQHWIVYPVFISFAFSVISFPHGLGMFSTGRSRNNEDEIAALYVDLEKFYREDHTFYKVIVADLNSKIGPGEFHFGTRGLQWNEQREKLSKFIMTTKTIHGDLQFQKPTYLQWT